MKLIPGRGIAEKIEATADDARTALLAVTAVAVIALVVAAAALLRASR